MEKEPEQNLDRRGQYKLEGADVINIVTGARFSVLDQLNENFRQIRLMNRALVDRDMIIHDLHDAVAVRDKTIKLQNTRIKQSNHIRPLLYVIAGSVIGKSAEMLFMAYVLKHLR